MNLPRTTEGCRNLPLRIANVALYQFVCSKFADGGLRPYDFSASVIAMNDSEFCRLELCFGERLETSESLHVQVNACNRHNPAIQAFVVKVTALARQRAMKDYQDAMNNRTFD